MDPIMAALLALAPDLDDELREGFQRYAAALDSILTPAQRQTYAALIRRVGAVQVFEDLAPDAMAALTPDEAAIATALLADETGTMENRRVAALLGQRGITGAAPLDDRAASAG